MRKSMVLIVVAASVSLGGCAALDRMTPEQREATAVGIETGGQAAAGAAVAFPGVGWFAAPLILAVTGLAARVVRGKGDSSEGGTK